MDRQKSLLQKSIYVNVQFVEREQRLYHLTLKYHMKMNEVIIRWRAVIELQGPHHYKRGYYDEFGDYITDNDNQKLYGSVENNFTRQCSYDERKKQYCEQHNINLECVKYTIANDYERLEKRIIKILKNYGYTYYIRT